MNAIALNHICKSFGSFAIQDLTLEVPEGTICGLVGENGAGKSTTIRLLMNALRPDSGTATVLGVDTSSPEFLAVKEDIGVVLDESSFHDALKVKDVDKILSRVYSQWDSALFRDYCRKYSLPDDKTVKAFSRGMKMKLSIAAALSHHPKLLLLDEATGGLDPVVLDEFLNFIQDEEHAILLSSHITSDLEKCADYIVYLHQGKITLQGSKDDLLGSYGRLVCTRADLEYVDPKLLHGTRVSRFSCEALVRDRHAFSVRSPRLTVDPVTLEEIMVFTVRGDSK